MSQRWVKAGLARAPLGVQTVHEFDGGTAAHAPVFFGGIHAEGVLPRIPRPVAAQAAACAPIARAFAAGGGDPALATPADRATIP